MYIAKPGRVKTVYNNIIDKNLKLNGEQCECVNLIILDRESVNIV